MCLARNGIQRLSIQQVKTGARDQFCKKAGKMAIKLRRETKRHLVFGYCGRLEPSSVKPLS